MRGRAKISSRTRSRAALASPSRSGPEADRRRRIRLETIGDIATVLGHESRNLFGALKTCLQILRRNPHLTGEDHELLEIIEGGSKRLGEVMADFAVFNRRTPSHFAEFSLHELLEEILHSLEQKPPARAAPLINKQLDPAVTHLHADRARLRHGLHHLLLNAVQAAGHEGSIIVETQDAGGTICITVRDDGPGIAASELPKIFEPLYTTKPRSAGLGLAVVRRIVEQHGGRITVTSKPGKGASFVAELPKKPKRSAARAAASQKRSTHGS